MIESRILEGDEFEGRITRLLRRRLHGVFHQRQPLGIFIASAMYHARRKPSELTDVSDGELVEILERYADELTGERVS